MKIDVQQTEKSMVIVSIDITAEQAQQEYNKACRRIGQRVNVPGFRRGKAPLRMIEKSVGAERIKTEALDRYLPYVFAEAVSEKSLDIVAPPRVTAVEYELGKGIQVSAEIDLRPVLTLPELAMTVQVEKIKADTAALEAQELRTMLGSLASLDVVEGRDSIDTDVLTLDFSGSIAGEPIAGGKADNFVLDIQNNHLIEGFASQLVGRKVGELFTIEVPFPEDYFDASLAGKLASFDITIHKIEQHSIPELTNETAAKLGNYATAEEVKEAIAKRLAERAENELKFKKQQAVVEKLVSQLDVEIPVSMQERELSNLIENLDRQFKRQGLSLEELAQVQGKEQLLEGLRIEAVGRIKTSLAFSSIAKQEGLQVSEEEFHQQVLELCEARGMEEKTLMRQLAQQPSGVQALTDQVLAQKVVDLLVEKATFELVDKLTDVAGEQPQLSESVEAEAVVGTPAEVEPAQV
jgi:trigger factor